MQALYSRHENLEIVFPPIRTSIRHFQKSNSEHAGALAGSPQSSLDGRTPLAQRVALLRKALNYDRSRTFEYGCVLSLESWQNRSEAGEMSEIRRPDPLFLPRMKRIMALVAEMGRSPDGYRRATEQIHPQTLRVLAVISPFNFRRAFRWLLQTALVAGTYPGHANPRRTPLDFRLSLNALKNRGYTRMAFSITSPGPGSTPARLIGKPRADVSPSPASFTSA